MARAKGVLPTWGDDREVLYKNPDTGAYFIGVKLPDTLSADVLHGWIQSVDAAVDALVARLPDETAAHPDGRKVAAVAAGFSSSFFAKLDAAGVGLELPSGFNAESRPLGDSWLPGIQPIDVDAMFYVAATRESRVNEFVTAVTALAGTTVTLERGFQRSDESESFGYRDGVRNIVDKARRGEYVFVDTDERQSDEPEWTDGGTYMVTMKIAQDRTAFAGLADDATRDNVIGRTKDGTRLDLVSAGTAPKDEGPEEPVLLPGKSHVRKSGPRGAFDETQIFRRGVPYVSVQNGGLEVGLQFCSFQATPAQFDTVFNEWMMNDSFPSPGTGRDALFDPAMPLTSIRHGGVFFVPPHNPDGLLAALTPRGGKQPTTGRLVVNKVVVDPSRPGGRSRRGGFAFEIHQGGLVVPDSQFTTDATGRGVCPVELDLNVEYHLVETAAPPSLSIVIPPPFGFVLDRPRKVIRVENQLTVPPSIY